MDDWARRRLQPKPVPAETPAPAVDQPAMTPVKREVKRGGKTHTQTYWQRPKK